ncbi:cobaltochelatase CobT-related protein [Prauserella alba]|uniref:cobaltochelatase CobT-related protein n=1 Tax=Prauserella alba TaxID=176898 RepID=UPI0020A29CD3|nr:cobalt chelatase [Prauserella alba]
MDSTANGAREQQHVEERCAAAIRALTGEPELRFRGGRLHRGHTRLAIHAPHLHPGAGDDLGSFRGAADGLALRVRHSDAELHRMLRPTEPIPRLVLDMLEQFRVEALAPEHLPGIVTNLRHRHVAWSRQFHHSGLTETARGLLLYTVAQVCRARVTGQPVVEETRDVIEHTRAALATRMGGSLAGLRRHRHDQHSYAEHARTIADLVGEMLRGADEGGAGAPHRNGSRAGLPLIDDEDDASVPTPSAETGHSRAFTAGEGYRVFTTAHDREQATSSLVRPELLTQYRRQLDRSIAAQGLNLVWLARALEALFSEPAVNGWDGAQEEGRLDGRRLAQLVASPAERRLFRTERTKLVTDCLVTFLVDCSGSMKQHAESVAVLVDVFAHALERIGGTSEILGFTTGAWNGGRAMRDWRRAGRPPHPGRLNERRHLILKGAETSWHRARHNIAALLKTDLYREGADGEAVTWACDRARKQPQNNRFLVVVSDGSPMDSATNLTNDEHYLDQHLTQVVRHEERAGATRIHGLGVGLDLSAHYGRSHALDLSEGVSNGVLAEVVGMLSGGRRR